MKLRRAGKAGAVVAMVLAVTLILPQPTASAAGGDWLDGSYGSAGTTVISGEVGFYPRYSMDSAGRQYVANQNFAQGTDLRRLTADGTVDPTFAGGNLALPSPITDMHADAGGTVTAVTLTGQGVTVSRFTDAGDPDPGFGTGGSVDVASGAPNRS